MKNEFFTDELVRLADIVPAAQSLQAERKAWLFIWVNLSS